MLLRALPFRSDVRGWNGFQNKVHSLGVFFGVILLDFVIR